jgi:hypothetical protein
MYKISHRSSYQQNKCKHQLDENLTNKTDPHDIAEILLKVELYTIKPNHLTKFNRIGGVIDSVLISSAVDLGFRKPLTCRKLLTTFIT